MHFVASDYSLTFTCGYQSLSSRMQRLAHKNKANKVSEKVTLFCMGKELYLLELGSAAYDKPKITMA